MGLLEDITTALSSQVAGALPQAAKERAAALFASRAAMAEADVYDRIRLARYVLTGSEEPPETVRVQNLLGETVIEHVVGQRPIEPEPEPKTYPYPSGDVLVLGPEVFAGVPSGSPMRPRPDAEDVVINWGGQNFVPQPQPLTGVVGPDPEFEKALADEDTEVDTEREPAPSAGDHWRGRGRGARDR